jgi:uncharacterized protein with GYD domain
MATYILLTRIENEAIRDPQTYEALNQEVTKRLHAECPDVSWVANYSVLGPYDYVDIFEAPDNEAAAKVAIVIRSFGHATTEIWPAVSWDHFRGRSLKVVGAA